MEKLKKFPDWFPQRGHHITFTVDARPDALGEADDASADEAVDIVEAVVVARRIDWLSETFIVTTTDSRWSELRFVPEANVSFPQDHLGWRTVTDDLDVSRQVVLVLISEK